MRAVEKTGIVLDPTVVTTMHPKLPQDIFQNILLAIKKGNCPQLETLLAGDFWLNGDKRNRFIFDEAIKGGQSDLVRCLLRRGVVPPSESPVFAAIREVKCLKVVLSEGYSVHVKSSTKKSPLHVAVSVNPACIPVLLRAGSDVTSRDDVRGNTPLHSACIQCEEEIILKLVQAGASLNCPNDVGETPLFCLLRNAGDVKGRRDFHVRSRHALARCLIHMGMRLNVLVTSSSSCPRLSSEQTEPHPNESPAVLLPLTVKTSPSSPCLRQNTQRSSTAAVAAAMTSSRRIRRRDGDAGSAGRPPHPASRKVNKVTHAYRQLLADTRRHLATLQHSCRVSVRALCENYLAAAAELDRTRRIWREGERGRDNPTSLRSSGSGSLERSDRQQVDPPGLEEKDSNCDLGTAGGAEVVNCTTAKGEPGRERAEQRLEENGPVLRTLSESLSCSDHESKTYTLTSDTPCSGETMKDSTNVCGSSGSEDSDSSMIHGHGDLEPEDDATCGQSPSSSQLVAPLNLSHVFGQLGISRYLQDYLLYKYHVLDKDQFTSPNLRSLRELEIKDM